MADNRKTIRLTPETWEKLNNYKHDNRLESMEAAIQKLLTNSTN